MRAPDRIVPERLVPVRIVPVRLLPERMSSELPERMSPERLLTMSDLALPRWAWMASGGVHLAALLAMVVVLPGAPLPTPPNDPIEVVVINQPPLVAGGGAPSGAAGVPAPVPRGPGDVPAPGEPHASAPRRPSPPSPKPRTAAPQDAKGSGDAARDVAGTDPVSIEGNLVPATPDSAYQNMTPAYPPLASAMGASGTVGLLLHVDPAGLVSSVEVLESSGWPVLDDAAADALSKWHFKPSPGGASFSIRIDFREPGVR